MDSIRENNGVIEYHINVVRGGETYVQVGCFNGQGTAIAMSSQTYNNSGFSCHSLDTSIATVNTTGITFIKNNAACSYYMKIRGGSKKGETKAQFTSTSATGVCGELIIHVDNQVSISSFDRTSLGAGNEKSVTITTFPAQLTTGQSVTLTCEKSDGYGNAIITDLNGNPISTIHGTTQILIRGTLDSWGYGSAMPDNMILKAQLNGGTGICAEQRFTVCAHPCNFKATLNSTRICGMVVNLNWESDSDSKPDLDKVGFLEVLQFSSPTSPPFNPPYYPDDQEDYYPGAGPITTDEHKIPNYFYLPVQLQKKEYVCSVKQLFICYCERCGETMVCENSGFFIRHCVNYSIVKNRWEYHITENGLDVEFGGYSTGAGTANIDCSYQGIVNSL